MITLKRAKCTSGAYLQIGTDGFRVGESKCIETRASRSARENKDCLGDVKALFVFPENNMANRRELQNDLIDELGAACSCNRIRA